MASITLSVPEELKKAMKQHQEVNWSGLARTTINQKLQSLSLKKQLKHQLKEEQEFDNWATELIRKGRKE